MRLLFCISLLASTYTLSNAQQKASVYEIWWAVTHPFVAVKAKKATSVALNFVSECKKQNCLDNYNYGGKLDAFRHSIWMALVAQKIGAKKAIKLGKAHEKNNKKQFKKGKYTNDAIPDYASIKMDLLNNSIAANLGAEFKKYSAIDIKNILIQKIDSGYFYIIKRNDLGDFIDTLGNKIPVEEQKMIWKNKKYLVKSNQ